MIVRALMLEQSMTVSIFLFVCTNAVGNITRCICTDKQKDGYCHRSSMEQRAKRGQEMMVLPSSESQTLVSYDIEEERKLSATHYTCDSCTSGPAMSGTLLATCTSSHL